MSTLADLEARLTAGERLGRADVERVLQSVDLISVGVLGDVARCQRTGDEITFGRVCEVPAAGAPPARGEAGEVRLTGAPSSIDEACARVRAIAEFAEGVPLTGFSAADLLDLCGQDHLALVDAAARLRGAGLDAIAECPIDRWPSTADAIDVVAAITRGGLGVWRLTVDRAALDRRLDLAERAEQIQEQTRGIRAFSPLPRLDPTDTPSTGYDDVRTIAMARLMCPGIERIQVAWPLYGPKLAQVALAYGANDIDGIAAIDPLNLGHRRSPGEDIVRQIRAAGAVPVERNGRYERLS